MPRRGGSTPRRSRSKNQGHRMHRRSNADRRIARTHHRPARTWDRRAWLEQMAAQADPTPRAMAAVHALRQLPPLESVSMGRKNHPRPTTKPQKPKRPKGGSK